MRSEDDNLRGFRIGTCAAAVPLEAVVVIAVLALLACGSLTPFTLDPRKLGEGLRLGQLGWPRLKLDDVVANLAVYLPVGASLALVFRRRFPSALAVISAMICGAAISFSFESAQTVIATRYASWYDVFLNTVGTLIGASLAIAWHAPARNAIQSGRKNLTHRLHRVRFVTPLLFACWIVSVAATASDGIHGLANVTAGKVSFRVTWIPLVDYFYVPFSVALKWAGELAVTYAALLLTAVGLAKRLHSRSAVAAVTWITILSGILGVLEANGRASISDAIIAIATAAVAASVAAYSTSPPGEGSTANPALEALADNRAHAA